MQFVTNVLAYMMLLLYMHNFKMIFLSTLTLTLRFCSRQRLLLLLQWFKVRGFFLFLHVLIPAA